MKNGLNKKQLESLKIRVIHEKERVEDGLTAEFDAYKINVEDLTDEVDQAASDLASSQAFNVYIEVTSESFTTEGSLGRLKELREVGIESRVGPEDDKRGQFA